MRQVWFVSEARAEGGAEVYLERLARNLRGWKTAIAVPDHPGLGAWRDRLRAGGVQVMVYSPGLRGWWSLGRRARGACSLLHVNLPSTYDGGQGLLAWTLAAASRRPVVVTEHLTEIGRSRRRRAVKLATARAAAAVIVVSETSRRRLVHEGLSGDRVVSIPNGVPDPGAPAALPGAGSVLRVGVLASLEPRKGIDVLLRAAAAAPPSVHLAIAGEGPERAGLEALASRAELRGRVSFMGRVADPYRFLAGCHLLALPSRLEAMPLSVLEAKAAGRGALVSALPGMDEIVSDDGDGRILPAGDVGAWAAALAAAAGCPDDVRRWAAAARESFVQRFTLEASVRATTAVYERALGAAG